jgi:protein SCO1/2
VIPSTSSSPGRRRPTGRSTVGFATARRAATRRSRTGVVVGALLAVGLLAGCGSDDGGDASSPALLGMVRTPALDVSSVELRTADLPGEPASAEPSTDEPATPPTGGEPIAMRAPEGELLVVYFGYTSCPDICPTTMSDLSVAINDLPPELVERVTPAMVSVDPDRDTPEVVAGYLGHFFDTSMPLWAEDASALAAAADAFDVRFEVAPHEPGDTDYEVSHSAVTYVVDDTGTVVVEWPFGFDSEQMTTDLTNLLKE